MCASKMHVDEFDIDTALVQRLLAAQFPHWANLQVVPVPSAGTDHALYRLGNDMVVRLPRIQHTTSQLEKEREWLPKLALRLPLAIPMPLAAGESAEGYPSRWSIYTWLTGEEASVERISDLRLAALDLARFITALRSIDPRGGPPPGRHNFYRGVPLAMRDAPVRAALAELEGVIDTGAAASLWDEALAAPEWRGEPVWIHGDIHPGNLLLEDGRIVAVIDFGGLAVGDPACDLMVAWNLLDTESRASFRSAINVDDATWARGRGWALSMALIALPYYMHSNPFIARNARREIAAVLAERTSRQ